MSSIRIGHFAVVAVIVAITALIYAGALHAPFVFDDFPNIVKNPYVQRFDGDFGDWIAVAFESPSQRPIANLSFALNHYFDPNDPTGYHAVNIVIHLINGVLVYALGLTLFVRARSSPGVVAPPSAQDMLAAGFAAILFVAHPIQVQSVTYIVQRMNSLEALFYLSALLLYIAGRDASTSGSRYRRWSVCVVCWALALGSKQTAITLPAVVFLYEWYFVRDLNRSWLRQHAGHFVAAAVVGLLLLATQIELLNLAGYADRDFTLGERLLTQLRVVVFYLGLVLLPLPSRLTLSHAFATSHSWTDPPTTLLSGLAIVAALVGAMALARRWRLVSFGILWFLLHLVLESSVLPLEMVFEHRLYLPMIGIDLIAAYLLFGAGGRLWVMRSAVAVGIAIALCAATVVRNETWSAPVTLWTDVVAKNPLDHRAQFNLGVALSDQQRYREAIEHHRESIRLHPDNAKAQNGLGVALAGNGRYAEAVRHFAASLRLDPTDPETRNNIVVALSRMGAEGSPPPSE